VLPLIIRFTNKETTATTRGTAARIVEMTSSFRGSPSRWALTRRRIPRNDRMRLVRKEANNPNRSPYPIVASVNARALTKKTAIPVGSHEIHMNGVRKDRRTSGDETKTAKHEKMAKIIMADKIIRSSEEDVRSHGHAYRSTP
jgi:hypothetical protein